MQVTGKGETLSVRRRQFGDAVRDMANCGWFALGANDEPCCEEIAANVWAVTPSTDGFGTLAYELATRLPGQLWPGSRSVSWVCGGNGPHGILVDVGNVIALRKAQDALADLGIRPIMPWTVGRLARESLRWVTDPQKLPVPSEHIMSDAEFGYHSCKPGIYDDMNMLDCKSYYFQLLRRAPSLSLIVDRKDNLHWGRFTPEEKARFKELMDVVAEDKLLRNSLVGSAMGGRGNVTVYQRGAGVPGKRDNPKEFDPLAPAHKKSVRLPGGEFRQVGLLIIRTAYELCHQAAIETESVYSTCDSVTVPTGTKVPTWERHGVTYRPKAFGKADIIRRSCWKIGGDWTIPYKEAYEAGKRPPSVPVPYGEPLTRLLHPKWI